MYSSSHPVRVSGVENMKWSLTVSPVYVINRGRVIIPLFHYTSVCCVKPLKRAAGILVCTGRIASKRVGGGG